MRFAHVHINRPLACIILFLSLNTVASAGPVDTTALRDAVTLSEVRSHQLEFQAIADANGGIRTAGTSGFDDSAAYVAAQLETAGYHVTIQPFTFPYFEELTTPEFEQLAPTPTIYPHSDAAGFNTIGFSGSGDVSATVESVDLTIPPGPTANTSTSGCEPSDFSGFTPGTIALIQRGSCSFAAKAMNAEAAGAVAVIVFNEGQAGRTDSFAGTLSNPVVNIPVIITSYAIGESLNAAGPGVTVRIFVDAIAELRNTHNVIAELPGLHDRVVMAGVHLDSVPEGPGVNDNGSGSAVLLEIAKQMSVPRFKPRSTLRFAWWGAEERGLVGSTYYVNNLSTDELKEIAAYLELEMLGSPNFVRFVFDGDGSDYPSPGPDGSANIEQVLNDYFADQGLPVEPAPLDLRHSYSAFAQEGIPVGGLFGGDFGIKTAEQAATFGGTAGDQYDPCYHLACDTFDNVSLQALDEMSDAAAHLIQTFAMTSSTVPKMRRKLPTCEEMGYDFSLKIDPVYCHKSSSYWQKRPAEWPFGLIDIGGITYTKSEALAVMVTKAKGDKTYALFNETVAAKLNRDVCGPEAGPIDPVIAAADAWLAVNPPGSGIKSKNSEWDDGSPLYSELSEFNGGVFQIDALETYAIDGLGFVEIYTEDGIYFDWTSTRSTDAVIVKGGRDASVWEYDPESFGDFGLYAPINPKNDTPYGLSYIEFCFDYDIEINVRKFHDLNNDGAWDPGEPEIGVDQFVMPDGTIGGTAGWPYLFSYPMDGGFSDLFWTPETHERSFAGDYTVEEYVLPMWEQSALIIDGVAQTVSTQASFSYAGDADESHEVIFGNAGFAEITGRKFEDLNANGTWEEGESGLPGVEITLDGTDMHGNPVLLTVITGAGGEFSFVALVPGDYTVTETDWPPGGWQPSTPVSSGPHTLATGASLDLGWVFGNFLPGSIHGYKFHDLDQNGINNGAGAGEPGVPGWTINLLDEGGSPIATTTTDANGEYGFAGLTPGTYQVSEEQQSGWEQTTANPPSLLVVSGREFVAVDGQANLPPGSMKHEYLEPLLAFGNFELSGSIHGYKFDDLNGNGLDDNEPRLADWVIELSDGGGILVSTTTTDANGEYAFTDLSPGTYQVTETDQAGWTQTTVNPPPLTVLAGQEYVAVDGMAQIPGGSSKYETIEGTLAFGNFQLGSIHGYKFSDLNSNGADDTDPRLPGWVIELTDGGGTLIASTVTDANGEYWFTELPPGAYTVTEVPQAGWVQTTPSPPPLTIQSGQEYVAVDGLAQLPSGTTKYETLEPSLAFGNFLDPNQPPVAEDDAYDATGNVGIDVPAGAGLLANDHDPNLPPQVLTVTPVSFTTAPVGGTVNILADGSFTYMPPAGYQGSDTFDYTLNDDSGAMDTGTVTITIGDLFWFVDNSQVSAGDGTLAAPFNTLGGFESSLLPGAGDCIFLEETGSGIYSGPLTLLNGQVLVGNGSSVDIANVCNHITLATHSMTLPATGGARPQITSAGDGIVLANGNTIRGLDVGDISGSGFRGTAVGALTISEVAIGDGTPNGGGIEVSTSGALNVIFDSLSANSTTDEGIRLNGVSGSFAVTGITGTIETTGVPAIDIDGSVSVNINTLTFASVSSNGGPNGIILTDTTGSFTVTGDGSGTANASGGTIQNTSGAGISLTNTSGVSLTQLNVNSTGDHGIDIASVTDFTFQDAEILDAGDADDEHSVRISNLYGTSLIEDVRLDDINEDAIEYHNTNADDGTRDVLTVRRVDFEDHTLAGFGENGIDVRSSGTSLMGLVVDDSSFTINDQGALGVLGASVDSSNLEITVQDSTFNALDSFGPGTIQISNTANSTGKNWIAGNVINDAGLTGIVVNNDDDSTSEATISGNTVNGDGTLAQNGFGIQARQDENGTYTLLSDNNGLDGFGFDYIRVFARDTTDGSGILNSTITSNTSTIAPNDIGAGINDFVQDTNTICADINGNDIMGSNSFPGFDDDIIVDKGGSATLNLEQTSQANLSAVNNGATTFVDVSAFSTANCPTPVP